MGKRICFFHNLHLGLAKRQSLLKREKRGESYPLILNFQFQEFKASLAELSDILRLEKKYDTLVSGKKAGIYKIKKLE